MLTGQRGRGQGALRSLRASLVKRGGFTLIETLVVVGILFILATAFSMSSNLWVYFPLSSAKIDLQSKVRIAMNWITRDTRESVSWDMAEDSNNPSPYHIKFRQVEGINMTSGGYLLSTDYIEYIYNNTTDTITRNIVDGGNTTETHEFNEIVGVPFYTVESNTTVVLLNEDDVGNADDLQTSGKLIVKIKGRKKVWDWRDVTVSYNLTTEVKIRNE